MKKVMDYDTAEHFYAWLEKYVPEDEQHDVEQMIHALLADDPELVKDHSWPEMRAMAEKNLKNLLEQQAERYAEDWSYPR